MATYNHFYDLPVYQKCSCFRQMEHLITAFDEKYFNSEQLKVLNIEYKDCLKELNIYIKYLKSAKEIINNK